jgi:hypothetical protein
MRRNFLECVTLQMTDWAIISRTLYRAGTECSKVVSVAVVPTPNTISLHVSWRNYNWTLIGVHRAA